MTTRAFNRLAIRLKRLAKSERGTVAPLIGLMFFVLIGCMGMAIDTGRAMIVKARLIDALDAAGLAVGARAATTDYNGDAKRYVTANFKPLYVGATVTSVTAVPNTDGSKISLTAAATMPTAFMRIFGVKTVAVSATSEITRETNGLELVMVLDNTGSMEISGSMPGLKAAANGLVNDLFKSDSVAEDLYIGLVPFSQAVNIGTDLNRYAWTDLSVTRKYYPDKWTGCVEARRNGYDLKDDPPGVVGTDANFKAYYSPDINRSDPLPDNNWIRGSGANEHSEIFYIDYNSQQGPGAYCPQPMTPMTNVKSKITAGVNAMTPAGSTMINLGAVWGWRMLSPKWRGRWGGDMDKFGLPLDYGTKHMSKAVILMTDGENQFAPYNYTAYGELTAKRLGTDDQASAEAVLNTRLATVCNSMKSQGITVITVAYDNPGANVKSLLQNCASNISLYFDAGSTSDLIEKFKRIAGVLSSLRVSR